MAPSRTVYLKGDESFESGELISKSGNYHLDATASIIQDIDTIDTIKLITDDGYESFNLSECGCFTNSSGAKITVV